MRLRTRLTVAAAVAVAIAIALASAAAYAVTRHELRSQVDTALRRSVQDARVRFNGFDRDRSEQPSPGQPRPFFRSDTRVQIVRADGSTTRPVGETALPVGTRDLAVAGSGHGAFLRDARVKNTHVRMITVPLRDGAALQVGRSLAEVDSSLGRLGLALVLVALGGVALAVGLGFAVSRAALQPVGRLTAAAEHIAETQDLGASIHVRGRDELARLGTAFNEMLAALDASRRQQRQLIADASHELRTPLTSLRTNLEVLARQREMPEGERERLLADVTAQLEELGILVTDLVELEREDQPASGAELVDVRLDELLRAAIARAHRHAPQVSIELGELDACVVHGQPARLERALANVLDNACKWSPPHGTVEIGLVNGEVVVRDHGPGIAAEDLPFVFDRFYRAPSARSMPGSGLGLAIVRGAVETHGGRVSAQVAPGGGTIVRISLPVVAHTPSPDGNAPAPRPGP